MSKIKLFATDMDGTLTDAGMYYTDDGKEFKKFNTHDGMGFKLLRESGIKTAIITSEVGVIAQNRAKKLKVDFLSTGEWQKLDYMKNLCENLKITLDEVAYIGDDVNDLDLLNAVKFKACPNDSMEKIKQIKDIKILTKKGGEGAVREFIDFLLENRE